jgi:hypothetical protein
MSEIPNQAPAMPRGAHALDEPTSGPPTFGDGYASADDAGVDLSTDPFADNLAAELAAAAPKVWHNRVTYILGALVLVVGGFLGGVQVQKHFGTTPAANARANAAAAFAAGRGGGAGFGRGGGTGAGTGTGGTTTGAGAAPTASAGAATTQTNTGKVTLVDGTTVYVTLASGDVLTVKTTSTTKVSVGSVTKVSGLTVGQSVTVTGPTDSNGNVTATSISAGS